MNCTQPATTYPKIETLFDRRPDFTVDTGILRRPEYGLVDKWLLTEKVDGTNVRLVFAYDDDGGLGYSVRGKSDNASLHPGLLNSLQAWCADVRNLGTVADVMDEHGLRDYTLFGEGYGAKIQSGGKYRTASQDQGFVLFDVLANGSAWLDEDQITATADRLGLERVPFLFGATTIADAVALCTSGFASDHAQEFDPTFMAEGVVAKTAVPLYDRRGERVMWKLKQRDFKAGKR